MAAAPSLFLWILPCGQRHHPVLSPVRRFPLSSSSSHYGIHSEDGRRIPRKVSVICGAMKDELDGGGFLDDDGVVIDMDGYLNHLSLEYESVWDTKPSWCQPWTIFLTGVAAITFSWIIVHSVVFSAFVTSLMCTWWYIFLYSYPKAYKDMIAERRKKVKGGEQDTFGNEKIQ